MSSGCVLAGVWWGQFCDAERCGLSLLSQAAAVGPVAT